jgi:DNA polymerase
MQSSLFGAETIKDGESLEAVLAETLEKGRLRFPDRTFVMSTGPHDAEMAVVGESPGPPDVMAGRPFMGPAGDLLRKILGSIGLQEEDCYLTNTVKFISQGDEVTSDVIAFFAPLIRREIAALRPRVVLVLGATPAKALIDAKQPISKIRGEFVDVDGISVMPTFNPAYLLRDPTKKREVWSDMKKVREFLSR